MGYEPNTTAEILKAVYDANGNLSASTPDTGYEVLKAAYEDDGTGNGRLRISVSGGTGGDTLWEAGTGDESIQSITVDYPNNAAGYKAFAVGEDTNATGDYAVALGLGGTASFKGSFASGKYTQAIQFNATAMGDNTIAGGNSSFACGSNNEAYGTASHSEGYHTHANGHSSHSEGYRTNANGEFGSHAGGYGNPTFDVLAHGIASFNHSYQESTTSQMGAYGNFSAILGGTNNKTNVGANNSVVLGGQDQVLVESSTVLMPKVQLSEAGGGIIMKSPNGTRFNITVDDAGNLVSTAV